jgi:hypothetical protein
MRLRFVLLLCCLATFNFAQEQHVQPAWAKGPKVEFKGSIERVEIARGQGMPSMELKGEKGLQRVLLGSMRYLMEHNFNPKAGSIAIVKGVLFDDVLIAQSVSLQAEKITIQLRDENGVPLWRRGRFRWRDK